MTSWHNLDKTIFFPQQHYKIAWKCVSGVEDVEEEASDSEASDSDAAESDDESDEGSGDLERLREEAQGLRQVLADREEELR